MIQRPPIGVVVACLFPALLSSVLIGAEPVAPGAPLAWQPGEVTQLEGLNVTLSKPVLVGRRRGFLWFPTLVPLAGGELLAIMSNYADEHTSTSTSSVAWSRDGGLSWSPVVEAPYGESHLRLPGGDQLILPYYLRPTEKGVMAAPCTICPKGAQRVVVDPRGVRVSGFPHPDKSFDAKLGLSGFVFNGQTVELKGGRYLATLYGYFENTKRYALVAAESADGHDWKYLATIAGPDCPLKGEEGPSESALCRLRDGRLLCVFRLASHVPFGQSTSSDEGKTWSPAEAMDKVFSVQPSLQVFADGMVALSGGRDGLFLWLNRDGSGRSWQAVDVMKNHNAMLPDEPIKAPGNTSSYTEIVVPDANHLIYIYDRIPRGWQAIPAGSPETNSVWVVQATIEPKK